MTLNPDFTLSEDELKVVREAIIKTMAEFLAQNNVEEVFILCVNHAEMLDKSVKNLKSISLTPILILSGN